MKARRKYDKPVLEIMGLDGEDVITSSTLQYDEWLDPFTNW